MHIFQIKYTIRCTLNVTTNQVNILTMSNYKCQQKHILNSFESYMCNSDLHLQTNSLKDTFQRKNTAYYNLFNTKLLAFQVQHVSSILRNCTLLTVIFVSFHFCIQLVNTMHKICIKYTILAPQSPPYAPYRQHFERKE